jgi:outer membrane protein
MKLDSIRTLACAVTLVSVSSMLMAQDASTILPSAPSRENIALSGIHIPSSLSTSAIDSANGIMRLTRKQAETTALSHNPQAHISELLVRLQHDLTREARADVLPNLNGNVTAVQAYDGGRISSGGLNASRLINHSGGGVTLSQLVTDFGHTTNLIAASRLREKARLSDAVATRQDIILITDQLFYQDLEAESTLKLATQTVATRQATLDQVNSLTASKLRSDLDLSFAQVNLSQAKLLELDARNKVGAAKAALNDVMGYDHPVEYELVDDVDALPALPPTADALVTEAVQNRPDLESLRLSTEAAEKFRKAQRDQFFPSLSILGAVGGTPTGSSEYITTNWYGAIGANLSIPIFTGFRINSQASEAAVQLEVAGEKTRALRDQVVRDVSTAWLNASTALERVSVTEQLLKEANTALGLARTRYRLGLSSIVELSQAELQQTQAAIDCAGARYQYEIAIAQVNFETGRQP